MKRKLVLFAAAGALVSLSAFAQATARAPTMLRDLRVKNLALIDELELSFAEGLNVVTGETGAGKSLLMLALGLAIGGRATSDLIRHEAPEATIEAMFSVDDARVTQLLEEGGYTTDDELLVRRIISQNGRSRVYLNGSAGTVTLLRQLGDQLMHVYGQHEHQVLLEADAALVFWMDSRDSTLKSRKWESSTKRFDIPGRACNR